jgi:hypothetical protein
LGCFFNLIFFFLILLTAQQNQNILDHTGTIILKLIFFPFLLFTFSFSLLHYSFSDGFLNDQANHLGDRLYSSRGARRLSWIYGHFSGLSPSRASCNRDSISFLSIHAIIDRRPGLALIFLLTPSIALPAYRALLRLFSLSPLGLAPAYLYTGTSTHITPPFSISLLSQYLSY